MANLSNINNKFIVTDGGNGRVLIGATNDIGATLFANHPSTTAPSLTFNAPAGQVFENEDLQIAFGLNNASPYNGYMQTRFVSAPYHRNLAINPLGGNVGIGTNSPGEKLEVKGNIVINSQSTSSATTELDQLIFRKLHPNGAASGFYNQASIRSKTFGGYSGGLNFYTNKSLGAGSYGERLAMSIDNFQNVGIGTDSPNKELTLGGAAGTQTLSFTTSAYLGDQAVIGNIEFSTHNADASYAQLANIYALKTGTNTNSGDITFWTKRNGARSEKIRIENDGTLRIKEGSIIIDSTSQGIFLGGTATAHKLDFYKTDTWAPQIYYQNATDQANATNSTQTGIYTKIGNVCTVQFRLIWTQASGTPAVDNIGIKNLPFGGNTTQAYAEVPCSLIGYTGGPSPRGNLTLTLPGANQTLALFNDTNNVGNMGNAIGSGTKEIRFSFTYLTN